VGWARAQTSCAWSPRPDPTVTDHLDESRCTVTVRWTGLGVPHAVQKAAELYEAELRTLDVEPNRFLAPFTSGCSPPRRSPWPTSHPLTVGLLPGQAPLFSAAYAGMLVQPAAAALARRRRHGPRHRVAIRGRRRQVRGVDLRRHSRTLVLASPQERSGLGPANLLLGMAGLAALTAVFLVLGAARSHDTVPGATQRALRRSLSGATRRTPSSGSSP
jgi:hypothetical protein